MMLRQRSAISLALAMVFSPIAAMAEQPDFQEVARILSRRCLHCHNEIDRDGGFSLQTKTSIDDSGYIVPGDAEGSELVIAISSHEGEAPSMPKEGAPLTKQEKDLIASWIEAGARWPAEVTLTDIVSDFDWWSFQPVVRPDLPSVSTHDSRNPIDAFLTEKRVELGLQPSPIADRRTLIRRLTYDLTGLPPTPVQIDAFVQDPSDQAYEKLVERLLDSKEYGERWARHWLDIVKYADTCGYDKDKLRPNAWPYRDYVIRSFNEDKPYGQFVREQIAGDVLFPGNPDGLLGLGFLAAGPWDFIGHVEVPESKIDGKVARNLDRDEMVTNTLNTFCSVTVQCARCHNHKFDPFTQEHYYSLQAVFAAVDRADRPFDSDPQIERQRSELEQSIVEAKTKLNVLDRTLTNEGGEKLASLDHQISQLKAKVGIKKSPAFGYHSKIARSANQTKWVEVDFGRPIAIDRIVLHAAHDDFAGIGAGFGFPLRYHIEFLNSTNAAAKRKTVYESSNDESNPGLLPVDVPADGQVASVVRVTATKLAERRNDFIFAVAELEVIDTNGENVAAGSTVRALDSIEAPVRWSTSNLVDSDWARATNNDAHRALVRVEAEREQLWNRINTPERLKQRASLRTQIAETQKQLKSLPQGRMVYAATTTFQPQGNFKPTQGVPREIAVLHRGDIRHPVQSVGPGTLPLSEDEDWKITVESESERRAQLAHWLTDPDHPLVWRSIVNRVWQYHFGEGIVSTPNDFGRMGSLPTHPELLDWLAVEFRDGGQSFKQLHRLIVTSRAYRQTSDDASSNVEIDNDNRYLWRMNRRRLTAEEIRDSILSVSGQLNPKMGGPGFYLFALEKTEHSPHYQYHKFDPSDPNSHRRSIYRFVVRSQPDPYMSTLDCADSSQSTPKRLETLTSLQALSLLNNRFNLEMANRFASDLILQSDNQRDRVHLAFRRVTGRDPSEMEREHLNRYAERHGLPNLCRLLFNLSEFIFID